MVAEPAGSTDPNGMELMVGETEAEYVARQATIKEEAKGKLAHWLVIARVLSEQIACDDLDSENGCEVWGRGAGQ